MSFDKWKKESKTLVDEIEDFAYNYKCDKCSEFYCGHVLKARVRKFGKRIDENLTKPCSLVTTYRVVKLAGYTNGLFLQPTLILARPRGEVNDLF